MKPEIESLINEGWTPRIKTRKNRRYITLRKGNKERSLGPYSDKLWEKLKTADPWATPSQVLELDKRIRKLEGTQQGPNPSLLEKRIKQLEESHREANTSFNALQLNMGKMKRNITELEGAKQVTNPSLLKKKISKLEKSQRESKRSFDALLRDFQNMQDELLESAERRLRNKDACKHINKNGFCLYWWYSSSELVNSEYLKPMGYGDKNGKRIYYINVRKHPLICSACPDYECKS